MNARWLLCAGLATVLSVLSTGSARAQDPLRSRDRLLLYYNSFYRANKERQALFDAQNVFRSDLGKFRADYERSRNAPGTEISLYDQMIRETQYGEQQRKKPLPPIYRGAGGQQKYFMRFNYFNPPTRHGR